MQSTANSGELHEYGAAIGVQVVDTVGDSDAVGVGTKVVIVDQYGLRAPGGACVLEATDQLLFLCVDADQGPMISYKFIAQVGYAVELSISVFVRDVAQLLVVDAQGEAHLFEKLSGGVQINIGVLFVS